MKVIVPVKNTNNWEASISSHFGRAPWYAIIDTEKESTKFIENRSKHFGGTLSPPDFISSFTIDAVMITNIGTPAFKKLKSHGLTIYITDANTLGELLEEIRENKLTEATEEDTHEHHGNVLH